MKSSLRLLGGAASLLALSLGLTACNVSPYAAKINSHVIKETALYSELRAWAGNTLYVSAFDATNSGTNSGSGITVVGDAPDTYSTAWVASILREMIDATLIDQDLAATGQAPSPEILAAARSVEEVSVVGWNGFPLAFRDTLTTRLANQATITPPSVPAATLLSLYTQYRRYFFTQLCVLQAAAFSAAQAQNLAAGGLADGTPACYDQAQFEQQPQAFQSALMSLAVGKTAPAIRTSYGYEVVKVVSRSVESYGPAVQRVLSVAVSIAEGAANPVLVALRAKARIEVNPAYGTWTADQVVPPAQPSPNRTT